MRWLTLVSLGLIGLSCFAQEAGNADKNEGPKKFYKLDFVVQEVEGGTVVNSRNYSVVMSDEKNKTSVRAEERIPYVSGTLGEHSVQYQSMEVGVLLDCQNIQETVNGISARVRAEITSVVDPHGGNVVGAPPITRNNQWESYVTLPLRRPAILFSSDDPGSKRTMRLQLTVTPIP